MAPYFNPFYDPKRAKKSKMKKLKTNKFKKKKIKLPRAVIEFKKLPSAEKTQDAFYDAVRSVELKRFFMIQRNQLDVKLHSELDRIINGLINEMLNIHRNIEKTELKRLVRKASRSIY